jgi:hypothetical protein
VVEAVPYTRRAERLLFEDLPPEVDVEAPEVDQLARCVDLRLVARLALAEHRGRGQRVPPRPGEQFGGLEEDGGPIVVRHALPPRSSSPSCLHGSPDVVRCRVVQRAEDGGLAVRLHDVDGFTAAEPLVAADRHGQLDPLPGDLLQPRLERGPLCAARGEVVDGLVDGRRDLADGVEHGASRSGCRVLQRPTRARKKNSRLAGRSAIRRVR